MKRVALPFLALACLVLLVIGLRQALQGGVVGNMNADLDPAFQNDEHGHPAVSGGARRSTESGSSRAQASDETQSPPSRSAIENAEPTAPMTESQVAEPIAEGSLTGEHPPLKRYEDADGLAMRRARQIELVTEARRQARESLEAAEERGDTEVATRTRGLIRRLQLRLDALEAAASALDPY